jgi:hypothetical protein
MKITAKLSITVLTFMILMSHVGVSAVYAGAKLYFDPASATKTLNETFDVVAKVNSSGEIVGGVDGVGVYDSSRLELVSITKASDMVFTNLDSGGSCQIGTSSGGKFSFTCYANSAVDNVAVSGSLVVFKFKAKATGTGTVSFSCTSGSTIDSNIVQTSTSSDVISCSENGLGSYTINEGSGSSSTTTSTPTPTSTTTTTTTTLPQTGSVGVTIGLVSFGLVSLLSAVFLKFL